MPERAPPDPLRTRSAPCTRRTPRRRRPQERRRAESPSGGGRSKYPGARAGLRSARGQNSRKTGRRISRPASVSSSWRHFRAARAAPRSSGRRRGRPGELQDRRLRPPRWVGDIPEISEAQAARRFQKLQEHGAILMRSACDPAAIPRRSRAHPANIGRKRRSCVFRPDFAHFPPVFRPVFTVFRENLRRIASAPEDLHARCVARPPRQGPNRPHTARRQAGRSDQPDQRIPPNGPSCRAARRVCRSATPSADGIRPS